MWKDNKFLLKLILFTSLRYVSGPLEPVLKSVVSACWLLKADESQWLLLNDINPLQVIICPQQKQVIIIFTDPIKMKSWVNFQFAERTAGHKKNINVQSLGYEFEPGTYCGRVLTMLPI